MNNFFKYIILILYLIPIGDAGKGLYAQQNLVLNPSFEDLISCPSDIIYLDSVWYWTSAMLNNNDPCYSIATSPCCSYSNNCGNPLMSWGPNSQYQLPKTGNTMMHQQIFADPASTAMINFRDYAIGMLSQTLINGKTYCGKVYLNLSNVSPFKTNQFGMYFDNGSIDGTQTTCTTVLNKTPQIKNNPANIMSDTLGWMKIEGSFIANGTENHVTLGNFKTDAQTIGIATNFFTSMVVAVYNIDDLSLMPIEIVASAGRDTSICVGDSVSLGRPNEVGLECNWFVVGNPIAFANSSNLNYKPTTAGSYTLVQSMDNCQMSYDTVVVTVCNASGIKNINKQNTNIHVYPNPSANAFNINLLEAGITHADIKVYDVTGKPILNQLSGDAIEKIELNTNAGVYFLMITNTETNVLYKQKLVVQH